MPYKNKEDKRRYDRQNYKKNRKKLLISNAKRYQANRENILIRTRAWQLANPDKVKSIQKRYSASHLDQKRASRQKRKARILGSGGSFTEQEWKDLCEKYESKCLRCKIVKRLTADHVIPVTKGGTSNIDNIQPLCGPCNASKGVKTVDYR